MPTSAVLIADTTPEHARELCDRVKADAWTTASAVGLDAAKEAIDGQALSLVLADASLWSTGGLGAYISENHPKLPVVVLTARDDASSVIVKHLQLGAMTFVPRDVGRRRLAETIRSILDLTSRNPFRERVRTLLRAGSVELHVGPDPAAVGSIVGYLQRLLEDYGLSDDRTLFRVGIALTEGLANAIIHGNLEISSSLREEGSDAYFDEIESRQTVEPYSARLVQVLCRFSRSSAEFVIRDQGKGFDPASLPDPTDPENMGKPSGRGIMLMRAYSDLVSWNKDGTEVTLVKQLTA